MFSEYTPIEVDTFKPLGSKILLDWATRKDTLLDGKLIAPELTKKWGYTGIVLKAGDCVPMEIKIGQRLLFEQFCGFEKFTDKKYGRIALVEFDHCVAIIPKRLNIESGEEDYDYEQ